MSAGLRSILRDGLGSISRRTFDSWRKDRDHGGGGTGSCAVDLDAEELGGGHKKEKQEEEDEEGEDGEGGCGRWAELPPELLREVVTRVEQSEVAWPARQNLVACAAVCRSWRGVCKEIVGAPETTGNLTFPVALKQPGPRNGRIQCYIKRNKATSTYQLFLGLNTENGKFLLAARKIRRPTYSEYILSISTEDVARNSVSYMGKLRSNFLGTKFVVYDSQPPYSGSFASSCHSSHRFCSRKVSPKVPSRSCGVAHIAYELNMLGTRGPRRMCCTMHSIPASALDPNGSVPSYYNPPQSFEESFSSLSFSQSLDRAMLDLKSSESSRFDGSSRYAEVSIGLVGKDRPLILKNKAPRWHEQLQCWCLNFRGRVTVASVKNFQLIAASGETTENPTSAGPSQSGSSDHDKIILQFGKIGKDLFTMDYRYPLSAFQAFSICLSSFDTKLACE